MPLQQVYIVIADISGYTRFIRMHKVSLLHAEKIVGNLLEAMIEKVGSPLQVHELLGDAVTFHAFATHTPETAINIYAQMKEMHIAFMLEEARHVSECSLCNCEACATVDQLRLKIIAHHGEAAITEVAGITKISGETVIEAHRLLKNSIPSDEYYLITPEFYETLPKEERATFSSSIESLEGFGRREVYYKSFHSTVEAIQQSLINKILRFVQIGSHMWARLLFGRKALEFRNLPGH